MNGGHASLCPPYDLPRSSCTTGSSQMSAMRKLPVVLLCRRPSRLPRRANQNDRLAHPVSARGAFGQSSPSVRRGAVDACGVGAKSNRRAGQTVSESGARTTSPSRVRQNRVVLAPEAGVKSCGGATCPTGPVAPLIRRATVATELVSPGRSRHKPSNHSRREGRDVSAAPWFLLCFLAQACRTGGHGCQPAPGLPCTLSIEGVRDKQNSDPDRPRERRTVPT